MYLSNKCLGSLQEFGEALCVGYATAMTATPGIVIKIPAGVSPRNVSEVPIAVALWPTGTCSASRAAATTWSAFEVHICTRRFTTKRGADTSIRPDSGWQ